jgi:KDO2-lipid IV(A) lauroyltransferase
MILNFLEFIWMSGIPRRIEKVCYLPVEVYGKVQQCGSEGTRIIFVNPHLGSWETSGLSAPYYGKVALAAIAKPTSNKYLNKLISSRREQAGRLQVIFARGAMRAAVKALKSGMCLGTLIDQNTKVRDGGCLVDFFGLPVASSAAPAVLMRYCRSANIPAVIFYAVCVRENKRLRVYLQELAKPFDEYASDQEVIQELMRITEDYIRRYPDQYVWLYRRFRYIPREASEAQIKRFPYYAENVKPSFYDRRLRGKSNDSIEMKSL